MNIVWIIGAFNAVVIAGLGLAGAMITMLGKEADVFWNRVVPACGILVGTSIASGIVMAVTRWLIG